MLLTKALLFFLHPFLDMIYRPSFFPDYFVEEEGRGLKNDVVLPGTITSTDITQAFKIAEDIVNQQRERSSDSQRSFDPSITIASLRHQFGQRNTPRSFLLGKTHEKFEEATRVLSAKFNLSAAQVALGLPKTNLETAMQDNTVRKCKALYEVPKCESNARYRTYDGSCNNKDNPTWGMASVCFVRLLDPHYADGISEFRLSVSGRPLPSPRAISSIIHNQLDVPSVDWTILFMQWGQFVDHDVNLTPLTSGIDYSPLNCCPYKDSNRIYCAPILLKEYDLYYEEQGGCLNNVRSTMCATCKLGPRSQINQVTSFIDGSQIYGNSENESASLRSFDGSGTLKTYQDSEAGELPPKSFEPTSDGCSYQKPHLQCFQVGDARGNQHPALTTLHTIFVRHHNRIARKLKSLNGKWDDEKIFQQARRIVGAQVQMITFNEFLPIVLGPQKMQYYQLNVQKEGYTEYIPQLQPTAISEFATAAFRFGHSLINHYFHEMQDKSDYKQWELRDRFFYPFDLYEGQADRLAKGMATYRSQDFDRWVVDDVTKYLYRERGSHGGLDLAALNIMRGRDHGLPPYVKVVEYCGGPKIRSFLELALLLQPDAVPLFPLVYDSVEDIDLFSGGLAERKEDGAAVGPTFSCIIGTQFYRWKYGDRYYFEHSNQDGSMTPEQMREIKKMSLAKFICDTVNISDIQPKAMLHPDVPGNNVRPCEDLPGLDLSPWKE